MFPLGTSRRLPSLGVFNHSFFPRPTHTQAPQMSSGPRLISLDAFAKTVEDARVKTASGGLISVVCVFIVMFLIRNEYLDYTRVVVRPELAVDRDVNKQLDISLDISFADIPCGVLTLDILDLTGDVHLDLFASGFDMFRVLPLGAEVKDDLPILSGMHALDEQCKGLTAAQAQQNEPCGSCYGALDQSASQHCCNTCQAVRLAYATKQWGFFDGSDIAQCEAEGYVAKMKERIANNEGCRVKGSTQINRIAGNLHFAPGAPFSARGRHSHDLSLWRKYADKFTLRHRIHHFSFGAAPGGGGGEQLSVSPLDGYAFDVAQKEHVALYYLSVVATRVEFLDAQRPPVDTNQYSVITHDRPIVGGRDDDHQNTLHAQGGVPGAFFHFDILPMKIINREQHAKTWSGFVLGVVSSIAGVLTVGAVLDRSIWAAEQVIRGKKDL
ncbi:DUF1692-domain-containing protein [Metschnikowia bicuspidata var. bicuspidata NRRL YB-4993]|uniref:Endoplasmic reticulum-Golgi intermediate compartment protein n=1 Tax=Metschnikowia bicuspidata var. bicuspidata NRRL YB-4993 TaxID=869754 RepID=A0A1A0HJ23_9ASCO|nr:DUF1692-domain-containing protein [Metschnikowia bicuspidata var. bicuspidata NRRL YB-4993]OBA24001.1 DUF1692-domain-containing protein [Metschnikowia bicuspidata var. bicuspidata NRRL YB-4993]